MSISTNIARRGGSSVYYARLSVPSDLQRIVNKKELWKSLGTRDPRAAREKVLPVLMQWRSQFAELRRRREPTPHDLQMAVWGVYEGELENDRRTRATFPTDADVEVAKRRLQADIEAGLVPWSDDKRVQLGAALDLMVMRNAANFDRDRRAIYLRHLKEQSATGETALISVYADQMIERERLLIARGSASYRHLCQLRQRSMIEALERAKERDSGHWAGEPADPIVRPPDLTAGNKFARPGESVMELYDRFRSENPGSTGADTWDRNRKIVKLFAEFIGETSHVSSLNRKAVRDWKHKLTFWPSKAAEIKVFDGLSFRKVIEANGSLAKPTISQKTINKYLSALGSFAEWLLHNEFIETDVMRGMYLSLDKRAKTRFPYTNDQLKTIFQSPLFTQCAGSGQEHKPGNAAIRDWRYWIAWIGLYTGGRLGEIAQLLTADVRQIHGTWIFHITREGSTQKSTKTEGSQRVVPIHSKLIGLGFLNYHAAIATRGEKQLFPEITADSRGFFSGGPSGFFNAYFRRIGVKSDESVNFHSFRHGMADAFRRAGYLDEQFGLLLGHAKSSTTGMYGILPEGVLSERIKMIEAVDFGL